ncbi:MAG: alkaline phosphatase [Bacillota bacterium]
MNERSRKMLGVILALALIFTISAGTTAVSSESPVKNVIIMVPDGTGVTHTTLARWYQGGVPLALDEMAAGLVRCYSAESAVTDSAPAATAMATGYKSNSKYLGVLPSKVTMPGVPPLVEGDQLKPVATVLEGAKLMGKATGLVATSNIQHATPAAFSAHTPNRNNYEAIGEQQVYQGIDVVLSAGSKYLVPPSMGGTRKDGENLLAVLQKMGYQIVKTKDEMIDSKADKLWGMFAHDAMAYDFDRDPAKEPSLAEMTQKAIEILSRNPNGFFLHVEGSKIDWASHANDPIGVISDILSFDRAVRVALDFAKKDSRTLILVASDHGNGGMSIGDRSTDKIYDKTDISASLDPLKKARLTGEGIEAMLNQERSNVVEVMAQYYGITDLTPEEIAAIKGAMPGRVQSVAGPIISKRAHIGWTTGGHTGEDIVLYSYGPNRPVGVIENTEFAKLTARSFGFDLEELSSRLFVPVRPAFQSLGAEVKYNNADPFNPIIEVSKGNVKMELPIDTSIAKINGQIRHLKGLAVKPENVTYVPQEAIDLFKEAAR